MERTLPSGLVEARALILPEGQADGFALHTDVERFVFHLRPRPDVRFRVTPARASFDACRSDEIFPREDMQEDAALQAFIRRKAEAIYHPVASCRMGQDPDTVVGGEPRGRGVAGQRVVDASVRAELPSGNTDAPTNMSAEVAADLIGSVRAQV